MKKVIVASKNPVKINAVKLGFEAIFSDNRFEYEGVGVQSGVSEQPMSDLETMQGAFNRALNASKALDGDYWVGIEGGVEEKQGEMEAFAWVVVLNKEKRVGKARSAMFYLPPKVMKLIKSGIELGIADDMVFKRKNSKQENGSVGILTGDVIDRTSYYKEAVILALIPFRNEKLYK